MNNHLITQDFQKDPEHFPDLDQHLSILKKLAYVRSPESFNELPLSAGVYTLIGGGLTGKTTLLKQWMMELLKKGIPPKAISFFSCSEINDYHQLINLLLLKIQKPETTDNKLSCIFLDDITYVHDWYKALQFIAENNLLNDTMIVLSSSDNTIIKKISLYFPNRDQQKMQMDFRLYPLTFHEYVSLEYPNKEITIHDLFDTFNRYLLHGGYLPAINDIAMHGEISDETLKKYSDWLKKELIRSGKQEHFLLEILTAIIKHYNEQITWNMLSQELSINHPKTIADYVNHLEALNVVFVQSALQEKTLSRAPKKARKLMFTDPFIFHALRAWIHPNKHIFENEIKTIFQQTPVLSKLVEACVTTHYSQIYPVFYIKSEGEIDLVYISEQRFWPIVVTWTDQLRAKDLKQILKYPNGKILLKAKRSGLIEHVRTEPLPQALWRLGKPDGKT